MSIALNAARASGQATPTDPPPPDAEGLPVEAAVPNPPVAPHPGCKPEPWGSEVGGAIDLGLFGEAIGERADGRETDGELGLAGRLWAEAFWRSTGEAKVGGCGIPIELALPLPWSIHGTIEAGARLRRNLGDDADDARGSIDISDLHMEQTLTASFGFAALGQVLTYQRSTDFADRFWRPQRGVLGAGFTLEWGFFSIRTPSTEFRGFPLLLRAEWLHGSRSRVAGLRTGTPWDRAWSLGAIEISSRREGGFVARILEVAEVSHSTPISFGEGHSAALDASDFRFTLLRVARYPLGPRGLRIGGYGGLSSLSPYEFRHSMIDPSAPPDAPVTYVEPSPPDPPELERLKRGPVSLRPALWGELVWRRGDDPAEEPPDVFKLGLPRLFPGERVGVGVGTFHRLDSRGDATDVGGQMRVEGSYSPSPKWLLEGAGALVVAYRDTVGPTADKESTAPAGSRFVMGRLDVAATWQVSPHWAFGAKAWIERSDRDDPIVAGGPPPEAPRLLFGGDFGAALSF